MLLGELIDQLRSCPKSATVAFDFCGCVPTTLDSWRGDYAKLALGWAPPSDDVDAPTVEGFLEDVLGALGGQFSGWKGGRYTMKRETEVWVDNGGKYTDTELVGVEVVSFPYDEDGFEQGGAVVLVTRLFR